MKFRLISCLLAVFALVAASSVRAEEPVEVGFSRQELEQKWRARIQSFLDKGVIPLVDLESSLKRRDGEDYLEDALALMDKLGVALIAFDGYQAKKGKKKEKGYRWGYYIHELVNAYPDRFILATNGGTNKNWLKQKDSFVSQTEDHVRSGQYPIMGEFDFRHYMSGSQCRKGRTDRDSDIPLDGENGRRIFKLSAETGVAFVIHHEPEEHALDALEKMLKAYPKANVIVAHFGQIRHPEKQTRFGPELVRRLFETYPNLYYDLSTGQPGRRYKCNDKVLDTVIWQPNGGSQESTLDPAYKAILVEFSNRFVAGTDYGGGRAPLPDFLRKKVRNLRLIMRDLPDGANHDIGYRNAWKLLTGRDWGQAGDAAKSPAHDAEKKPEYPMYAGVISDAHAHLKGKEASSDGTIAAMDKNKIDVVLMWVKNQGGWTDDDTLAFSEKYPGRVIPGIAFQNKGWSKQKKSFIREVREKAGSGKFKAMGEVSVRGKIGGNLNAPPDSPLLKDVMDISAEFALPVSIHHNPYNRTGDGYERTGEYETFIEQTLTHNPETTVIWAHWCGQSPPEDARRLLKRFPNLYCELAWLHKSPDYVATLLVDENRQFIAGWKKLIEEFPDRFIVGVDSSATPKNLKDYNKRVRKIRTALGGLSPDAARKVATENMHRLFRLPQYSCCMIPVDSAPINYAYAPLTRDPLNRNNVRS